MKIRNSRYVRKHPRSQSFFSMQWVKLVDTLTMKKRTLFSHTDTHSLSLSALSTCLFLPCCRYSLTVMLAPTKVPRAASILHRILEFTALVLRAELHSTNTRSRMAATISTSGTRLFASLHRIAAYNAHLFYRLSSVSRLTEAISAAR